MATSYTVGENEQLYSILSDPFAMLKDLYIYNAKLSSRAAIALFNVLKDNNKLKVLYVHYNSITDDACDAITTALERNCCLVTLGMYDNPVTGKAIVNIVNGLKVNSTLELLGLPECPGDIKKRISYIQEAINKNRQSQRYQVKLKIYY